MSKRTSRIPGGRWCQVALGAILIWGVFRFVEQPAPAAGAEPQLELFFPQFGHGGTPDGLQFSSTISLINLSTTTSPVSVVAFDPNGQTADLLRGPGGEPTAVVSLEIPGSGTASVQSLNRDPAMIQTGSALVFSLNSFVSTQTEFSILDEGRLAARAQVPARPLTQAGSFFVPPDGRTGLAIMNPFSNPDPADVRVGTVNSGGRIIDWDAIPLNPGEQISRFLDELGIDTTGATSVEFRSDMPVAILPLQQDGLDLTNQDLFPPRNLQQLFGGNGN